MPIQLAAKAPDVLLLSQPQQCAKAELHHFALGLQTGGTKSVLHQFVFDVDVGAHYVYS